MQGKLVPLVQENVAGLMVGKAEVLQFLMAQRLLEERAGLPAGALLRGAFVIVPPPGVAGAASVTAPPPSPRLRQVASVRLAPRRQPLHEGRQHQEGDGEAVWDVDEHDAELAMTDGTVLQAGELSNDPVPQVRGPHAWAGSILTISSFGDAECAPGACEACAGPLALACVWGLAGGAQPWRAL
jgi:hypothetical protein